MKNAWHKIVKLLLKIYMLKVCIENIIHACFAVFLMFFRSLYMFIMCINDYLFY